MDLPASQANALSRTPELPQACSVVFTNTNVCESLGVFLTGSVVMSMLVTMGTTLSTLTTSSKVLECNISRVFL